MLGRDSLVFRNARLQGIALSALTCSKAGTLARSVTQNKGVWQSKRALDQPGLVLAVCLARAICDHTSSTLHHSDEPYNVSNLADWPHALSSGRFCSGIQKSVAVPGSLPLNPYAVIPTMVTGLNRAIPTASSESPLLLRSGLFLYRAALNSR